MTPYVRTPPRELNPGTSLNPEGNIEWGCVCVSLFVAFVSELCFLEFAEQASACAGIASMFCSGLRRQGQAQNGWE